MAGLFVTILNDNNIPACLNCSKSDVIELIDCPLWNGFDDGVHWYWEYESGLPCPAGSFVDYTLKRFASRFGLISIVRTRSKVPVRFKSDPLVPFVDVVLCTETSDWTPYRRWPFFAELKSELSNAGWSFVDLSQKGIRGALCLNYVSKCKLYVGLETGVSHLVSSVADAGLIIQSGYSRIENWSTYGYDYIDHPLPCSGCFLRQGCAFRHSCMREIKVDQVMKIIESKLSHRTAG